ncbi:drug/metabolite transporter (DMT)-like permease [Streptomyces pseudovenezuelae]
MMNHRRTELLAAGAATVTVVLWASAFVSIRSAGAAYSPGALALGRLLSGALALGVICLIRREGLPPRSAWRGIAISGVLWFGFYMVVLNWGEQQVDAGTAALVVNIGPILIALLGARLLGDAMPPRLLAGMAVSFAGAVTVGLSMSDDGGSSVLGVVLCLLAAIAYAGGVVAQKPVLGSATPLQATTFGCFVGAVVCLPFAGQLVSEAADAPASATLNMVYLGVFPTALAFNHLGLRPGPDDRQPHGRDHLRGARPGRADVVAGARRGPWPVHARGRGAVPCGRGGVPLPVPRTGGRGPGDGT